MTRRQLLKISVAMGAFGLLMTLGTVRIASLNRHSAISTATTWARLAPLPASAHNLTVETKGSMFTREFVITFDASPMVIQQWLAASPGPRSATATMTGSLTTYTIAAAGGAEFAEVKVDSRLNRVMIHTYWS